MKFKFQNGSTGNEPSPSMRREWIEIHHFLKIPRATIRSPSMRREWIEILLSDPVFYNAGVSPSMRREWIEMILKMYK